MINTTGRRGAANVSVQFFFYFFLCTENILKQQQTVLRTAFLFFLFFLFTLPASKTSLNEELCRKVREHIL